MAAHALTIMRQSLNKLQELGPTQNALLYVRRGLDAPGTCASAGFSWEAWSTINDAVTLVEKNPGRVQNLEDALKSIIASLMWMAAYPTFESIQEARFAYLRRGRPGWKTRLFRLNEGDAESYRKMRMMAKCPLNEQAPIIGA